MSYALWPKRLITVSVFACTVALSSLAYPSFVTNFRLVSCAHAGFNSAVPACTRIGAVRPLLYANLVAERDPEKAEGLYRLALGGERGQLALAQLTDLLISEGRVREAIALLEMADPLPSVFMRTRLIDRLTSANEDEIREWVELLRSKYQESPELVASAYLVTGRWSDAVGLLRSVEDRPLSDLELHILARSYFYLGQFDDASAIWSQLLQEFPLEPGFRYWNARAMRYGGHYQAALLALQMLVRDLGNTAEPEYLFELTLAYQDNAMCGDALLVTEQALDKPMPSDLRELFLVVQSGLSDCLTAPRKSGKVP